MTEQIQTIRPHYVPQFYLRNGWADGGQKISAIYLEQNRLSEPRSVKIRTQCFEKYLYSSTDETIERVLSEVEGAFDRFVSLHIDQYVRLQGQNLSVESIRNLLSYVCLQYCRTPYERDKRKYLIETYNSQKMFKYLNEHYGWGHHNSEWESNLRLRMDDETVMQATLHSALGMYEMCKNLSYQLINNHSDREFITSDNPVIQMNVKNQFTPDYSLSDNFIDMNGKITSDTPIEYIAPKFDGFQMIFPINSRVAVVFFKDPDSDIHSCNTGDILNVYDTSFIDDINSMQISQVSRKRGKNIYASKRNALTAYEFYKDYKSFIRRETLKVVEQILGPKRTD